MMMKPATTTTTTLEDIICKDAQRLMSEHPSWTFRLALSVLAVRYTSKEHRLKAWHMVDLMMDEREGGGL